MIKALTSSQTVSYQTICYTLTMNQEDFEGTEIYNPNNIGELLSLSKDIETFSHKVYRSVRDRAAIEDLIASGVVRNKQSAGVGGKSRWGDKVFWSRGEEDKYHNLQQDGYVIEAPYSIANQRQVTIDDISAVYHRGEDGEIIEILDDVLSRSLK